MAGFLKVPNHVIERYGFEDELLAFAELLHGSFPSRQTSITSVELQARWKWGNRRALRFLASLREIGVEYGGHRQRHRDGHRGWSRTKLDFSRLYEDVDTASDTANDTASDTAPTLAHTDERARAPVSLEDIKKKNKNTNPLFQKWYENYPFKKSKAQAVKSFAKLKPSEELVEKMLFAIQNQVRERAAKEWAGVFVPEWKHPSTWITAEAWEDDIDWKLIERFEHQSSQSAPPPVNNFTGVGRVDYDNMAAEPEDIDY